MVGPRVWLLALLLTLASTAGAEPRLWGTLDAVEVELGKAITLTLHARDVPADLAALPVDALAAHFVVEPVSEASATGAGLELQHRVLRLHPRAAGEHALPTLRFADIDITLPRVRVVAARSRGLPLRVRSTLSERNPWQRQQVVLSIEVASPDGFFTLAAEPPALPGADVVPLPVTSRKARIDGVEYTVQRIGWALFPHAEGEQVVSPPLVRYLRGGRTRYRFAQPQATLEVRALPGYLPPTIPVGRVEVEAASLGRWVRTGHLQWWTVAVTGSGIPADSLPPVLRSLHDSERLQVLPAETRHSDGATADGLQGRAVHRVPIKALADGPMALPTLRYQYFDPATGRLVTRHYRPQRPWAFGLLWPALTAALLAVATVLVLRRGVRSWRAARASRHRRRQALEALAQAGTPAAVSAALRQWGSAWGWPGNVTLWQWEDHWQRCFRPDPHLAPALQALREGLYAGRQVEAASLAHSLSGVLRRARRLRRHSSPARSADAATAFGPDSVPEGRPHPACRWLRPGRAAPAPRRG